MLSVVVCAKWGRPRKRFCPILEQPQRLPTVPQFVTPQREGRHLQPATGDALSCRCCFLPGVVRVSLPLAASSETMGHLGLAALPPPQAAFAPSPMALFAASAMPRHSRWSVGFRYRRPIVEHAAAAGDGGGDRSEGKHSEQKDGFRPPAPLEDDGFAVNVAELQDLVDSGE